MSKSYTLMELEAIKKLCKCVNSVASLPTDLIADTNVATNTTYSSYRIDAEMSALENDIQRYVDTALAGLSRLTKEVIDDKALVVKENVLYLYKDPTDTNNDYMQMMLINGVAIELGSTTCDFSSVYSKDEIDDKFALKIDLDVLTTSFNNLVTTVVKKIDKDNIVTVLDDTVTDEQVPSAKVVVDELGLKANDSEVVKKTDIATTINSASTDDEVPSAKSVYDTTSKFLKTYTSIAQLGLTIGSETIEDIVNNMEDRTRLITLIFELDNNLSIYPYRNGTLIVEKINLYRVNLKFCEDISSDVYVGTYHGEKGFAGWQKVCTTTAKDVPLTTITTSNLFSDKITAGAVSYCVKNGVCYVYLDGIRCSEVSTNVSILENMPKALITSGAHAGKSSSDATLTQYCFIVKNETTLKLHCFKAVDTGYCSFSYPVAE